MSVFDTGIAIQQYAEEGGQDYLNARSDSLHSRSSTSYKEGFPLDLYSRTMVTVFSETHWSYNLVPRSLSAFRRLRYVGERLGTKLLVLPRLLCMGRVWERGQEQWRS